MTSFNSPTSCCTVVASPCRCVAVGNSCGCCSPSSPFLLAVASPCPLPAFAPIALPPDLLSLMRLPRDMRVPLAAVYALGWLAAAVSKGSSAEAMSCSTKRPLSITSWSRARSSWWIEPQCAPPTKGTCVSESCSARMVGCMAPCCGSSISCQASRGSRSTLLACSALPTSSVRACCAASTAARDCRSVIASAHAAKARSLCRQTS
mmetsp:Transcript_27680/g.74895  ORF Transcript_27680/g.74895 Transcript_27680/m.74895 type:complete len:206 (+) Transcript_27680:410-1027(+)